MDHQSREDQGTKTTGDLPCDPNSDKTRARFKAACSTIWEQEIRSSLIHCDDLYVCQGCLGFFHCNDGTSTHPKELCFDFIKLCHQHCIASPDTLDAYLWREATVLLPAFGYHVVPSVTPIHKEHEKKPSDNKAEFKLQWCQGRIIELVKNIEELERENVKINSENRTLKYEMEGLIKRLLTDRRINTNRRMKAELLLKDLHRVVSDCDCAEDEEDDHK